MTEKIQYLSYYMKYYTCIYWELIKRKLDIISDDEKIDLRATNRIAGKKQIDFYKTNRLITEAIQSNNPFWAGRFGGMEMNMMASVLKERFFKRSGEKVATFKGLCNNAGFFPEQVELADQFVDLMLECCKELDLLGTWPNLYLEEYVIKRYMNNATVTKLGNLAPWNYCFSEEKDIVPWTKALEGKKVLVVHPFVDTIRRQYENNRDKIFSNICAGDDLLPNFELITLKAVQTQAGTVDTRFKDWFEALEWMETEIDGLEFDVAIIGCGAYGFPLAAHVKKKGKVAIHVGGNVQIMFGIRGKRWDSRSEMKSMYNDYWVRPSEEEKVKNIDRIEEGCYW